LEFIKNNNDIFIENDDINREIDFFMKIDKKISFTDVAVIKIAMETSAKLHQKMRYRQVSHFS